ncbi:unnamed protein product [Diamesa serratosioi]
MLSFRLNKVVQMNFIGGPQMELLKIPVYKWLCLREFQISYLFRRNLSIQKVTNHIKLYTEEPRKIIIDSESLRLKQDHGNRPLALILPFLGAKQNHLIKYANIYHSQGFDVVVGHIAPWNVLVPAYTAQPVASGIVKFLLNNDYYEKIFLHGFSVGAYLYGECILHMLKDMKKHQNIIDRVQGEIWDSLTNFHEIAVGLSRAIFEHPILQKCLESYLLFHLKTFTSLTTDHLKTAGETFHQTKNVHAPSLFFLSRSDIVSCEPGIRRSIADFKGMNVETTSKCFDQSPHVEHYRFYKEEYTRALIEHLNKVKMLKEQRA